MVCFGWNSFNGKCLKFLFCKYLVDGFHIVFHKEFCLSVVRKSQGSAYGGGFFVYVKAFVHVDTEILVVFHILLLKHVWFDETRNL